MGSQSTVAQVKSYTPFQYDLLDQFAHVYQLNLRGGHDAFHKRLVSRVLNTRLLDCAEAGIDADTVYYILARDESRLENARSLSDYYGSILADVQKRTADTKKNGS